MTMKKTIAGIIAGIVAVSAMATSALAADVSILDTDTKTTKAMATFSMTVNGAIKADTATTDFTIVAEEVDAADDCVLDGATVSVEAVVAEGGWVGDVTKTFVPADADLTGGTLTIVAADFTGDGFANAANDVKTLKITLTTTDNDGAKVANTKSIKLSAPAEVTGTVTTETYATAIDDISLLASEAAMAADNGVKVTFTFSAATAATSITATTTQSRDEYKVDIAEDATTATITLPAAAFSAGQANVIDFSNVAITGIAKFFSANVTIEAPAAVVDPETPETTTPDTTTPETTTPQPTNPATGPPSVALALIPVALAAAIVVSKKK